MKIINLKPLFQSQAFGALITILILNGLYINPNLVEFFKPIRYGLISILIVALLNYTLILSRSNKIQKNQFIAIVVHFFILIYGLYLSSINGGLFLIDLKHYLYLILSLIFTLFIFQEINYVERYVKSHAYQQKYKIVKFKSKFKIDFNIILPLLFLASPFILLLTNSLEFNGAPNIVYEDDKGSVYSQGTTTFFAVGAIVFTYLTFSYRTYSYYFIFLLLVLLMLFLSTLSGARGNFAIGLIVILLMFTKNFSKKKVLFLMIVLSSLAIWLVFKLIPSIDELLIVWRFVAIFETGTFGARDILLGQSIDLLKDQTSCFVIGCGFNYFQVYYDYNFSMYPHNIFAELLITFGIFVGMILIILILSGTAYGFFSFYSKNFFYWVLLYYLGISLKSGSLISITSIPVILFFAYLGICFLKKILKT
jgi:hypothetical protein